MSDMVREQVRIKYEFYKINKYFPELSYLNIKKNYKWKRKTGQLNKISLPDRMALGCFYMIDSSIKSYVKYILLPIKIAAQSPQWEPTKSTKKSILFTHMNETPVLKGSWNENTDWEFFLGGTIPESAQPTVVAAMVYFEDKIIMIRTKRGWELPGGHIEPGESVKQALYREVHEETGVVASESRLFGYMKVTNKKERMNKATGIPFPTLNYIPYFLLETDRIPDPHLGADVMEVAVCALDSEIIRNSSAREIILLGEAFKRTLAQKNPPATQVA